MKRNFLGGLIAGAVIGLVIGFREAMRLEHPAPRAGHAPATGAPSRDRL